MAAATLDVPVSREYHFSHEARSRLYGFLVYLLLSKGACELLAHTHENNSKAPSRGPCSWMGIGSSRRLNPRS